MVAVIDSVGGAPVLVPLPDRSAFDDESLADLDVAELAARRDVEYVDLPTGHWPRHTRPVDLGRAILASIGRS